VGDHLLCGLYDVDFSRAEGLAKELGSRAYKDADELLRDCDIAMVCTTNDALAKISLKAVQAGRHVLVEKPAAVSVEELETLRRAAKEKNVAVKVGFNHRFHPALLKAHELISSGALGPMMFLRARYGHGARLGYEKEWRSLPEVSGGGELLDQGVHLLDLIYWFMGPLPLHSSMVSTSFWDMKADDNAVLTLAGPGRKTWATFHVSCSEWKNTFGMEIYGRTGKILINGLGGSYGKETLTYYRMLPQMGPPETEVFEFAPEDLSWRKDLDNLVSHIEKSTPLWGDLDSALYAMTQVRDAYRANGFGDFPAAR
jgi:predicted dehydrogenase